MFWSNHCVWPIKLARFVTVNGLLPIGIIFSLPRMSTINNLLSRLLDEEVHNLWPGIVIQRCPMKGFAAQSPFLIMARCSNPQDCCLKVHAQYGQGLPLRLPFSGFCQIMSPICIRLAGVLKPQDYCQIVRTIAARDWSLRLQALVLLLFMSIIEKWLRAQTHKAIAAKSAPIRPGIWPLRLPFWASSWMMTRTQLLNMPLYFWPEWSVSDSFILFNS